MRFTAERRLEILLKLNIRRRDTIENLANEFNVSKRTIRYDIEVLSLSYPILAVPGRGGGVMLPDDWKIGTNYLNQKQRSLLTKIQEELNGEEYIIMQSIIEGFSRKSYSK